MQATIPAVSTVPAPSVRTLRAGRILSTLPVLFLALDGAIKLANIQPVVDSFVLLGLPVGLAPGLGALLLACLALYVTPRTSALGAVLLTGYLGGALAIQLRVAAPLFSLALPLLLGALLWAGLLLRDERVRGLVLGRR